MAKDLVKNDVKTKTVSVNPLKGIDLSEEAVDAVLSETIGETILGLIPGVEKLVNFLGTYQEKLDNARLLILLKEFKEKHESSEKFQESLKKLLASPSGLNLLQKIVRIVNAGVMDLKLIKLLATTLKKISDSDFKEMFEEHNYALSQIEKLTPQALLLLSDNSNWPGINFSSTTTSGVTSGKGWDTCFATLYSNRKGMPNERARRRITHSINELKNNHLIGLEATHLPLTDIGEEIFKYLS